MPRIAVMGVGNILMTDDGVGVHAVKALRNQKLPPDIITIDAGTSLLDAIQFLEEVDLLIIIDAIHGDGSPGTIYQLSLEDISTKSKRCFSTHHIGVLDALKISKLIGNLPDEIIILGVEPKKIDIGENLSPIIFEKIEDIINIIMNLIFDRKDNL